ncbi:MAG: prephenate dehydratase [Taibaiella sp.]|nr:prephenate dehydratase [Taibaiella sp.]
MNIAIQGYPGSFHHEAVQQYFGKTAGVTPCASFRTLVDKVGNDHTIDAGLMAIENSIAGSILPNYSLLFNSGLLICGEVYLSVRQQLMAHKGVALSEIKEVHSHYMALLQCNRYLEQCPWKLVETEDTALSARKIKDQGLKHIAAIAGKTAAELYQLDIIASDIQDQENNYTRFLILKREATPAPDADKASISFRLEHKTGSLAKVLNVIAAEGLNISKLQSFPVPDIEFQYYFILDLEFEEIRQLRQVLASIKTHTHTLTIKGIYKKSIWKLQQD